MKSDNLLVIVAAIAVIVSASALLLQLSNWYAYQVMFAPADDEGTASVQIASNAKIDFTWDTIDWGAGYVTPGETAAWLDTKGGNAVNWENDGGPIPAVTEGFILENIGNVDLDLSIGLETPVDTWLPEGTTSGATLEYAVTPCAGTFGTDCTPGTMIEDDTSESCLKGPDLINFWMYQPMPEPPAPAQFVCNPLYFVDTQDEIRIDLQLMLPAGMPPTSGVATNTVIADIVAA